MGNIGECVCQFFLGAVMLVSALVALVGMVAGLGFALFDSPLLALALVAALAFFVALLHPPNMRRCKRERHPDASAAQRYGALDTTAPDAAGPAAAVPPPDGPRHRHSNTGEGVFDVAAQSFEFPPPPELVAPELMVSGTVQWSCAWLATLAAIGVMAQPLPQTESLRLLGLGIGSAVAYGVLNDLRACCLCTEYFTLGHTPFHSRLLATDAALPNALAWGACATWKLGIPFGPLLALAARFPLLCRPVAFAPVAAAAAALALLALLVAEWRRCARTPRRD
jgi:hypothetical protein